jgi:hypothetical protein
MSLSSGFLVSRVKTCTVHAAESLAWSLVEAMVSLEAMTGSAGVSAV